MNCLLIVYIILIWKVFVNFKKLGWVSLVWLVFFLLINSDMIILMIIFLRFGWKFICFVTEGIDYFDAIMLYYKNLVCICIKYDLENGRNNFIVFL